MTTYFSILQYAGIIIANGFCFKPQFHDEIDTTCKISFHGLHLGLAEGPVTAQNSNHFGLKPINLHCKCLQGFAGLLWGNQSAGISNLRGLHVTCFPCNLFKAKTTIIVGNMIYRSTMGIPCIYYRE